MIAPAAPLTREDGRRALAEANRRYLDHERVCRAYRMDLVCLKCQRLYEADRVATQQLADACFAAAAESETAQR